MDTALKYRTSNSESKNAKPSFGGLSRRIGTMALALVLALGMVPIVPATTAYADNNDANDTATEVVDGELLVVYEDGALRLDEEVSTSSEVAEAVSETGSADALVTLEDLGVTEQEEVASATSEQGTVTLVQLDDSVSTEEAIVQLEATEGIAYVQPNYTYSLLTTTTDDPYAVSSSISSSRQYYLSESGFTEAWDYAQADGSVTIATIDTGCNLEHEDLAATVDSEHAYDVTSAALLSESGVANNGDANGHGTLVAGVIAAQANNATGIAGASYNANILPINVFGDESTCTSADIIAAYDYLDGLIDSGEVTDLRVINVSLGYYSNGDDEADEALHSAISSMLDEHDVLTVAAGGNGSTSGSATTATCYPSDFDECLSVTSLDEDGSVSSFSDYNSAKDISAYGANILSTTASGGYSTASGTSMAAPQVAAAAALLSAADSSLSSSEIVQALKDTAIEVSDMQAENGSAGALNVEAAVKQVLGVTSESNSDSNDTDADTSTAESDSASTETDTSEVEDSGEKPSVDDESSAGSSSALVEGSIESSEIDPEEDAKATMGSSMEEEEEVTDSLGLGAESVLPLASTWSKSGTTWTTTLGGSTMTVTNATAFGIDVSYWQGTIDWAAVKDAGVEYAILRCGYVRSDGTKVTDSKFVEYVKGCIANDIPFGVYLYSYGDSVADAATEANHVLSILSAAGLDADDLDFPVYYDLEDEDMASTSNRTLLANMASTFCGIIENAGYTAGVYANKNWFTNYLTSSVFDNWTKWVAQYPSTGRTNATCSYTGTHDMWQCMSTGRVNGISGNVDIDFYYGTFGFDINSYDTVDVENGTYYINAQLNDTLGLQTASGGTSSGTNTALGSYAGSDAQKFKFTKNSDGTYTITHVDSGLVLDVAGANAANSTATQLYASNGTNAQKWYIRDLGDGYCIQSALGDYVLDIDSGNAYSGASVRLYEANGTTAQKFMLASVDTYETDSTISVASSLNSNLVLDIVAGSTDNGARLQLYTFNSTDAQLFRLYQVGNGVYEIKNMKSNKLLEVTSGNTSNGSAVGQYSSNGTLAQHWTIYDNGDGTVTFVNCKSGKALDIPSGEASSGKALQIYTQNGTAAQVWVISEGYATRDKLDELALENANNVDEGTYAIALSASERQVIDVTSGSTANTANVQVYASNASNAQRWKITKDSEGYLTLTNVGSGKVLDVASGSSFSGTNVQQYDSNGTYAQKWIAIANDDGTVTFHSALAWDLVLDIASGSTVNGANVQVYSLNNSAAQCFTLWQAGQSLTGSSKTIDSGTYVMTVGDVVLDVTGGSTVNGALLQSYVANGTAAQSFYIEYDSSTGYYTIKSVLSGRLLDADNGDCVPGGTVSQYGSTVESAQQRYWVIEEKNNGTYAVKNAANGMTLGLSSTGKLITVTEGDSREVQVSFESSGFEWGASLQSDAGEIKSALGNSAVLDVESGATSNGANVQLYAQNGTGAQSWKIVSNSDGTITMLNTKSGKALDVDSGTASSGTNVQQYDSNGTNAQKWIPVKQSDGSYVFFSTLGNCLVLDVSGGSSSNGTNVQVYSANGTTAQKWTVG